MATLYPDIKTNNWQISTVGAGYIAEGLADIRQCLDLLLRTQKRTDPLRPEFGCDIYQFIDKPLTYAIPNIIRAIIEAIEIWETRIVLKSVKYQIVDTSRVKFFIVGQLVNDELIDLILLYQNGGFTNPDTQIDTSSLTLYALFPYNPNGKRYTVQLIGDDNLITPLAPYPGFASIADSYAWVVNNWSGIGSWYLGIDRLTVTIPRGRYITGSLSIALIGVLKFSTPVPYLTTGQNYGLSFIPDGIPATPAPPSSFASLADLLTWVQINWAQYGTWAIEGNPYGLGDFDIPDFSGGDFDIGAAATYILVLYSETVNACVLQVPIA